jgi:hypothetical protein
VECLADLEKSIFSKSTPEQLVGSLAARTPEWNSAANVHHLNVLKGELSRAFDIRKVICRPAVPGGEPLQLGEQKGMAWRASQEKRGITSDKGAWLRQYAQGRWRQHHSREVRFWEVATRRGPETGSGAGEVILAGALF